MFGSKLELADCNYIFIKDPDYKSLKYLIKKNLVQLCYGERNVMYNDLKEVLEELIQRYEQKSVAQKTGFIGEFLYYVYISENYDVLKPLSMFFNQEDEGFKKSFDLLGYDGNMIWYSEVKSGTWKEGIIDDFNIGKIGESYRDVKQKLQFKNRKKNHWLTAKNNLIKTVSDDNVRLDLANIFKNEVKKEDFNNVILVSVVFHDSDIDLDIEKIKEKCLSLKSEFNNITIVSFRKKTVDKVISIIKEIFDEV